MYKNNTAVYSITAITKRT